MSLMLIQIPLIEYKKRSTNIGKPKRSMYQYAYLKKYIFCFEIALLEKKKLLQLLISLYSRFLYLFT